MSGHGGFAISRARGAGNARRGTLVRVPSFLLLTVAIQLGCGSRLPMPAPGETPTWTAHVEPLMLVRCLACHTAEKPEAELVLEPGRGYDQLVGRASTQVHGLQLVVPGDPAASYLWLKVDHSAPVGDGMPRTLFGAKRLPPREAELIRAWIEAGAPR